MTLLELFRLLAYGELSNLAMADKFDGAIDEAHHPQLVTYVNDGLMKLYTRYVLKESDLVLVQIGSRTTYPLLSQYSYSQSLLDPTLSPTFISDNPKQPFAEDVIKVLEVWDGYGRKLPLNDPNSWGSVFTPQPTTLQIVHPMDGLPLSIHYQASHPLLTRKRLKDVIDLPPFLHQALRSWVAHKVYSDTNTQENVARAQDHLNSFETSCVEVVDRDLVPTPNPNGGIRFVQNGWV